MRGWKGVILGLLEDMHWFFNGFPWRKTTNYFSDGPYISKLCGVPKLIENKVQVKNDKQCFIEESTSSTLLIDWPV